MNNLTEAAWHAAVPDVSAVVHLPMSLEVFDLTEMA
jgi:hypothetical protein